MTSNKVDDLASYPSESGAGAVHGAGANDTGMLDTTEPDQAQMKSTYQGALGGKPRWGVLSAVIALHVAGIAGIVHIFAPNLPQQVMDAAVSLVSVDVTAPPPPAPEAVPEAQPDPQPDEGAAAAAGAAAKPRDAAVPPVAIPRPDPTPAPPAASTGTDNRAGASDSGTGQGAGGVGDGLGSGRFGSGQGGMAVTKPEKIAGNINSASDFPVPEGGRQIRWGRQVVVSMTVGVDGRASNCRVIDAGPDPQAGPITCRLAVERFRFRPATDARGEPVVSTYGWRQWWEGPK